MGSGFASFMNEAFAVALGAAPGGSWAASAGLGPLGAFSAGHRGRNGMGLGLRQAMAGAAGSGLPPGLLLSDRDFTAEDYDALLRLDDRVENRKGATSHQIDQLPTHIVPQGRGKQAEGGAAGSGAGASVDDSLRCTICLEDIVDGSVMRLLPCTHKFHRDCIDSWLKQRAACPSCQYEL